MLEWFDKLVTTELDKQLPALVDVHAEPDAAASTIADSLGISGVLTGEGSITSVLSGLLLSGISPTPDVLAEQLSRTDIQAFLNLPKNAPAPTNPIFGIGDTSSYNHAASLKVFDSTGSAHDATAYYVKSTTANQWQGRLFVANVQVGNTFALSFSPDTDTLDLSSDTRVTLEDFRPSGQLEGVDIVLDFSDATQRDDVFKTGWTAWSIDAQGRFDQQTGMAGLHVALNGLGSTGDRQFDFSEALAELNATIPHDIQAVAEMSGALDFAITWDSNSTKPVSETVTLQVDEFAANVDVLVDTIQVEARLGLLAGSILDTGTQADPGTHNSYIAANADFTVELLNGEPVLVGDLETLTVGEDYSVQINSGLDGVLFYETILGGEPIPGDFRLRVGLSGGDPIITPVGDLDEILDQLGNLSPQELADVVSQSITTGRAGSMRKAPKRGRCHGLM